MQKKAVLIDAGGVILDESEMEQLFCEFTVGIIKKTNPTYSAEKYWMI